MDLYYRLNVIEIHLPALRERKGGIELLAHHFLERFSRTIGRKARHFAPLAMAALEEYPWPGNVRELENVIQRAVVLSDGPYIEVCHLPAHLRLGFKQPETMNLYEEGVREFKRRLIVRTLRDYDGNKVAAARALGITRCYLHHLINELKIQSEKTVRSYVPSKGERETSVSRVN
ncbi:MAG TPA: helix-turn-helix domain-containing protein [Terriglobia bacterium]|nr:helix-turn-helix domain-containing protein [Terriglobia bacterium]